MMPVSMVGRAGELAEFTLAWAAVTGRTGRAGAGRPRAAGPVVVTGDAGVGKSLLIAAALDGLAPRPATVLTGTARLHSPAPYDWLAAVLSGRDTRDLPLPVDALAWLAQQPNTPRERYAPDALLRLAVRTVRALVGTGPAVLVVEDLHALDPASLNLVGELAAASDLPALLVVASRPARTAVSPPIVAATLARLTGAPGVVRQHLGPLTPPDVAEVLGQVYPGSRAVNPEVVTAVWRRTGGNPYRLVELLATDGGRGPAGLTGPVDVDLTPRGVPARPAVEPATRPSRAPGRPVRTVTGPRSAPNGERLVEVGPASWDPEVSAAFSAAELTNREIEVLSCLAAGMSNKQVARSLGISVRTVTVHVSNLLRKTGSASRTEAALWAVRQRPVDPARPR